MFQKWNYAQKPKESSSFQVWNLSTKWIIWQQSSWRLHCRIIWLLWIIWQQSSWRLRCRINHFAVGLRENLLTDILFVLAHFSVLRCWIIRCREVRWRNMHCYFDLAHNGRTWQRSVHSNTLHTWYGGTTHLRSGEKSSAGQTKYSKTVGLGDGLIGPSTSVFSRRQVNPSSSRLVAREGTYDQHCNMTFRLLVELSYPCMLSLIRCLATRPHAVTITSPIISTSISAFLRIIKLLNREHRERDMYVRGATNDTVLTSSAKTTGPPRRRLIARFRRKNCSADEATLRWSFLFFFQSSTFPLFHFWTRW